MPQSNKMVHTLAEVLGSTVTHQKKRNGLKTDISLSAKKAALDDLFKPTSNIIQTLLTEHMSEEFLPKPDNLIRTTNLHRQKKQPKDPVKLDFTLSDYVPDGFFQKDVRVDGRRHLVFATEVQLKVLNKRWYRDATFKVIKAPFIQLLSVHCFLKSDEVQKQGPALYAFMSGNRLLERRQIIVLCLLH